MHPVKHYQVTFFKTVATDYGRDREIVQRVVDVFATSRKQAIERAREEFCRLDDLCAWDQHADRCEVREQSDVSA